MPFVSDPFDAGAQAYHDGVRSCDVREKNPYDADDLPGEWDEWEDGWATARLNAYLPWHEEVKAKIGPNPHWIGDFGKYFDEGMTPEEAIAENLIEVEKHSALLDPDNN